MPTPPTDRKPRGRPRSPFTDTSATTVQALERGLIVLRALARDGDKSLSDLSSSLNMPASTLHRFLVTLEAQGFARLDDASQTWSVGVEAFRTGSRFVRQTELVETGRVAMRELMERTGETANLAIPDKHEVVFIGQVETPQPIRAFFRPGTRGAMYASGIGKAILASMTEHDVRRLMKHVPQTGFTAHTICDIDALLDDLALIRARGWSLDNEERHIGMRCVAAAIHDSFGDAIGGISVSGPTARIGDDQIAAYGPLVRAAADGITTDIGGIAPQR